MSLVNKRKTVNLTLFSCSIICSSPYSFLYLSLSISCTNYYLQIDWHRRLTPSCTCAIHMSKSKKGETNGKCWSHTHIGIAQVTASLTCGASQQLHHLQTQHALRKSWSSHSGLCFQHTAARLLELHELSIYIVIQRKLYKAKNLIATQITNGSIIAWWIDDMASICRMYLLQSQPRFMRGFVSIAQPLKHKDWKECLSLRVSNMFWSKIGEWPYPLPLIQRQISIPYIMWKKW